MEILTDAEWAALSPESRHKINAYVKEAEKAKSERKWRTMDSAPKDGTQILVWCERVALVHWDRTAKYSRAFAWVTEYDEDGFALTANPLCWMPIPEPPNEWME